MQTPTAPRSCPFATRRPVRRCSVSGGRSVRHVCRVQNAMAPVEAGPKDAPPDYTEIDEMPVNKAIMTEFRKKMVEEIGKDSEYAGYDGLIHLTRTLNSRQYTPRETQLKSLKILRAMFPSWLPPAFKAVFSIPFPRVSSRLNAWVTSLTCKWLMGPCELNDTELDDGSIGINHGVKVERCRYLEQSGCAAVCINSCKVPTQEFFEKEMGLPLTMTPDYEDFSCQFSFGLTPPSDSEDEAFKTPCFKQCPTQRRLLHACDGIVPNKDDAKV